MNISKIKSKIKSLNGSIHPDTRIEIMENLQILQDEIQEVIDNLAEIPDEEIAPEGEPAKTIIANSGKIKKAFRFF